MEFELHGLFGPHEFVVYEFGIAQKTDSVFELDLDISKTKDPKIGNDRLILVFSPLCNKIHHQEPKKSSKKANFPFLAIIQML